MDISFELYKVFYHVAKQLSFSAASAELFVSQSAVSQSIHLLEEKLGCKLFLRHTKKVTLTQEGQTLFSHIEQAFHLIKIGERSISDIHALKQGEIKIAASDTICKYYLLPYLEKFTQSYPDIKISITNRTSPVCMDLVQKGMADVGIVNISEGQDNYKNMTTQKLQAIHDVFIAGNRFIHLRGRQIQPQELLQYPLLMLESNTVTRVFFEAFLEKNNLRITPEIELGSVDLLIELAKIGLGVSFVPREYITKELSRKEIFILDINGDIQTRHVGVITHDKLPIPLAARKFIEILDPFLH